MSSGMAFYDESGSPLWDTLDFNINTYGVYTVNAGVIVDIPLPGELYNSGIYIRRRNVIPASAVYSSGICLQATVVRSEGARTIAVHIDATGAPSGVVEVYVK
jgi:hypothetical protein